MYIEIYMECRFMYILVIYIQGAYLGWVHIWVGCTFGWYFKLQKRFTITRHPSLAARAPPSSPSSAKLGPLLPSPQTSSV